MLRYLFPRLCFATYTTGGVQRLNVWRRWLAWEWDLYDVPLTPMTAGEAEAEIAAIVDGLDHGTGAAAASA